MGRGRDDGNLSTISKKTSTHASHFVVPGKDNAAVRISAPSPSTSDDPKQSHNLGTTAWSNVARSPASSGHIKNSLLGQVVAKQAHVVAIEAVSSDLKQPSDGRRNLPDALQGADDSSKPVTSFSTYPLDVYAETYVPVWLQAVNASPAQLQKCLSLNFLNFEHYLGKFAGSSFLRPCDEVHFPPSSQAADAVGVSQPSQQNYCGYFTELLQREISTEVVQLRKLNLYNVLLRTEDYAQETYRFRVPGVRENAPQINLGDVVAVRPLLPASGPHKAAAAQVWLDSGACERGLCAPGFLGTEYQAVVWGVSKAREEVILRVDGLRLCGLAAPHACNVRFLVQKPKYEPMFRSLQPTGLALNDKTEVFEPWLRPILFPDNIDAKIQGKLSKGTFSLKWISSDLNYEQQKAISAVIEGKYGSSPYLIAGPPGTGKTRVLVEITLQSLKVDENAHLIVCSPSQSSADTLATRLSAHLTPRELFRMNSWTRPFVEVPDNLLPYSYSEHDLFSLPDFQTMMSYKVIVTTCRDADLLVQARLTNQSLGVLLAGMLSSLLPTTSRTDAGYVHWNGLLIDEAAQATEPEALIPLSVVDPGMIKSATLGTRPVKVPSLVMAGDEYQLGPRLFLDKSKSLHVSLFERLFRLPFYADHPLSRKNGNPSLKANMLPMPFPAYMNLVRSYRSNPSILSVPSVLFYHDTLIPERPLVSEEVRVWPGWQAPKRWPVLFKQISDLDTVESLLDGTGTGAGSLVNHGEAHAALNVAKSFLRPSQSRPAAEAHINQQDIIVMTPFRAQVKVLRELFRAEDLWRVNIGPLESFQGLEGRIVILCTTRTRLGPQGNAARFVREDQARSLGVIDEPKRFNVAITRAKEGLIVIGNEKCLTCTSDAAWEVFLAFCHRNGLVQNKHMDRERTVQKNVEKIGRLERALNYARTLESRVVGHELDSRNLTATGENRMKGRIMDEDEQMWMNGMSMANNNRLDKEAPFKGKHHQTVAGVDENEPCNHDSHLLPATVETSAHDED